MFILYGTTAFYLEWDLIRVQIIPNTIFYDF